MAERPANGGRSVALDALRGALVLFMAAYHAVYVAVLFGLSAVDLWHGFWWLFPRAIAAGFIALSGWSLAVKREGGAPFRSFLKRALRLALPAACVSAVSMLMFGDSWVFFGVLHLLALSSILAWPFLGRPVAGLVAGGLVLAAGLILGPYRWDGAWLAWLGFRPEGLYPADYLPVLPWFAWCLFGASIRTMAARSLSRRFSTPAGPAAIPLRALAFLGRHSLAFYLAHLPVLYGLGWLVSRALASR